MSRDFNEVYQYECIEDTEVKLRHLPISVSIFALIGILAVRSASAQALGTYTGTSADGNTVSFTVTTDSAGLKAVTSATIWYTAACPNDIASVNEGLGFGLDAPIKGKKAAYKAGLPSDSFEQFNLVFDTSNNTVTGSVTSVVPQLAKRAGTPTRAYLCTSAPQSLTASRVVSAASAAPAKGTVHYAR